MLLLTSLLLIELLLLTLSSTASPLPATFSPVYCRVQTRLLAGKHPYPAGLVMLTGRVSNARRRLIIVKRRLIIVKRRLVIGASVSRPPVRLLNPRWIKDFGILRPPVRPPVRGPVNLPSHARFEPGGRREVEGTSLRLTSRIEAPFYKGFSEENGRLGGLFLPRNAIKGELWPLF